MNITLKTLALAAALALPAAVLAQATPGEGDQTPPVPEQAPTAPAGPGDTGTGPSTMPPNEMPGATPTPGNDVSTGGAPGVSTSTAPAVPSWATPPPQP